MITITPVFFIWPFDMARRPKVIYHRRYRQPSLWNSLKFRISLLPIFNPMSRFPMSSRRNVLIRSVAVVVGDIATGVAIASVCVWLIESAALGLFLSFLVWLLGALLSLALSQYVIHPALNIMLSDCKLDMAVFAVSALADRFKHLIPAQLRTA
jgi:hypothetical protein